MKKLFNAGSAHLLISALTVFFGVIALFGVNLPAEPIDMANQVVTIVTDSGVWGLFGVMGSTLVGIFVAVYNKAKSGQISFASIFGNVNLYIYVAGFVTALLAYFNINVPADALPSLVHKIAAGDYFGSIGIIVTNLLNPIIRFIRDRRNSPATVSA